jgi:phosphoserine phosphatase
MAEERVLPSWAATPTRDAIVSFVEAVTGDGPEHVPEAERIAVFDNDGTLWTEKPMPTQLHFIVGKWREQATADPTLADRQPYLAATSGDVAWLADALDKHYAGDDTDLRLMVRAIVGISAERTVDDYASEISEFFRVEEHPVLRRPYAETVYQPMVELLQYLEQNGFTTYIVSAGDRDFMRPMTADAYGVPPERVVGSAMGLVYTEDETGGDVRYAASFSFLADGPEKPIRIWSRIGRRPILAAGNANGDLPMLRFVQRHPHSLSLLIHHDDDTGRGDTPYDKGAEKIVEAASSGGFVTVSVKHDWTQVFPGPAG